MSYLGHVKDGVIVLEGDVPLPEGALVSVDLENMEGEQVRASKRASVRDLVGLFTPEDLDAIEEAIRDCRKVEPDGW
ncbi:MAG: hypothetical protein HUU16_04650 [Candidatus Omnitrophica bacterium]|nr:hypothetical protein [bacterium]NUN95441.1 hypothetical protein [Candidatus Omnitrophota bacterium]